MFTKKDIIQLAKFLYKKGHWKSIRSHYFQYNDFCYDNKLEEIKWKKFKEYIHKYPFNKEFKLIKVYNQTDFNYARCFAFWCVVSYNERIFNITYYESVLMPIGISNSMITSEQGSKLIKNIPYKLNFNGTKNFSEYVKNFNNSILVHDKNEIGIDFFKTKIDGIETELHGKGEVTLDHLIFEE